MRLFRETKVLTPDEATMFEGLFAAMAKAEADWDEAVRATTPAVAERVGYAVGKEVRIPKDAYTYVGKLAVVEEAILKVRTYFGGSKSMTLRIRLRLINKDGKPSRQWVPWEMDL